MSLQTSLIRKKKTGLALFHTIGTLNLMELFVLKVEKVSEQERNSIKLCPKIGKGITRSRDLTLHGRLRSTIILSPADNYAPPWSVLS